MAIELLNPEGLPKPDVYRQVAIGTGTKLVFLAGQVARDADGVPVGAGDLAATRSPLLEKGLPERPPPSASTHARLPPSSA
jgi:enamine deaminase RidA (YjgF/YER057c/UK114 family)